MKILKIRAVSLGLALVILSLGLTSLSCSNGSNNSSSPTVEPKVSTGLQLQIGLRAQQLSSPTPGRLAQMQSMGMNTENIRMQRIYIYLSQPLTEAQTSDLKMLGITLYPDSWIPPVANQPAGFMLADIPVDKLDALAGKDYVIRLDTAENALKPLSEGTMQQGSVR